MLPVESEGPSVGHALDRVVDAAQNVVLDQVGLVRLEAKEAARTMVMQGVLMGAGVALVLGAWGCLAVAFYIATEAILTPLARLGILAAFHAAIGLGLLVAGLRQEGSTK